MQTLKSNFNMFNWKSHVSENMTRWCRFYSMRVINVSVVRLILFCLVQCGSVSRGSREEKCEMRCSNVFDYVCGVAEADGIRVIHKFQNTCHLNRIRCRLRNILDISQVPDRMCNIKKTYMNSRRVNDFSIVGAHQACNHTCPTYCIDTYEPACAQIWKTNMKSYTYRPMINHCHIDLFSCAVGVNVTIQPLGKCYKNPSGLLFMSQVAAMKSLRLLDDTP
ncbi:hypothetical protein O3G_MSEX008286 [Manduca sexta]|uniref:Uncharacterized protein n=1 Tax=Manduca sexta TaxID=7130 RepID=A0A921Z926_MANSE|nr:hypothetical protein O3G_MSEX008286 [Manduca sexta]